MSNRSPLRYPGGKAVLSSFLEQVITDNNLQGCTYAEPFAGGAGAAIELLINGHVDRILINDADRAIYCFWNSIRKRSAELIEKINETPLTITEWRKQRDIYKHRGNTKEIELGFAAFFLNRCNRSGIIKNAGPIGGIEQSGTWKIDARFNREQLSSRIEELASYGDRILVSNEDANSLLYRIQEVMGDGPRFIYADPPYYAKGRELYLNYFNSEHHKELAQALKKSKEHWILSYDDTPETRKLYTGQQIIPFQLRYSAHHDSREGGEILVNPSNVVISEKAKLILQDLGRSSKSNTKSVKEKATSRSNGEK